MSKTILTGVRYFVDGADLTGAGNKLELEDMIESKEVTNWGSSAAKEYIGGLESVTISAEGQWEAGDPGKVDDVVWANRRAIVPHIIGPNNTAAVASLAYVTKALINSYKVLGTVGDVAPWSLSADGSWPLARGYFLQAPGTTISSDGNGTAVQLGAVDEGQYLYAAMAVLSVSDTTTPTLDVKVQSDDSADFTTGTDRITFTQATAVGGEIKRLAGPITDDWYRVVLDVTGTSASFLAVVAVGIA